ncbi:DUF2970 domain-containing protein [Thalassotalea litorea]|uniref:DUF2970 domain-containing protein n=1 Tax=Thalassotalea litorea TaxID=2020715 RepID=A0A5R9IM18_9GAMM|nr:DUF2970 domain-containing protein [Thalassotalea litorea]TLU61059.1 DUF2970 domain-containing protein [Thalassotalea litorea]
MSKPAIKQKSGLIRTIVSVLAAFIGVQSDKNRVEDFENGSAIQFIVIGLIAVVVFVLTLVWIVSLVLNS